MLYYKMQNEFLIKKSKTSKIEGFEKIESSRIKDGSLLAIMACPEHIPRPLRSKRNNRNEKIETKIWKRENSDESTWDR